MPKKPFGNNKTTKKVEAWNVKEQRTRAPQKTTNPRVDLDPLAFDDLIKQKGVKVLVYRTTYCPNTKSVDGAEHNIDCMMCNGSGFVDLEPICVDAYIQNQDLEHIPQVEGFVDGNSVAITFPSGVELQYFTRIDLVDFTDIYFQRVMRTEGETVDVLKYKACRVNILMDSNGVRYYQGQDFDIDPNGNIQWGIGTTPADNVIYTIHYETHVQFRATRALHVNRFSQFVRSGEVEYVKYPEQWICTKEFLVKRKDLDGNELEQGPYDNHTIVED